MSAITRRANYRVVVEPRRLGDFGLASVSDQMVCPSAAAREKEYRERCDEIAEQIKRRVDNVAYVSVEFDEASECEHCGSLWTEESGDYNGGCCTRDQLAQDKHEQGPPR